MNKSQWKVGNRFVVILITPFLIAYLFLAFLSTQGNHVPAPNTKCRLELMGVKFALNGYQSKYTNYPTGNQAQIIASLCGENSLRYEFLDIHILQFNSNKECLDPWETPLKIEFSSTNSFVISSAGKDKIFGTADDIIINNISNDFVKP
jgi:hypothetical protein